MSDYSFEAYAERARLLEDPTLASGRLLMREDAARRIVHDIIHKLDIRPTDELLDIGCGIGQLGIPLSFLVKRYVGIDHPDVVKRFKERLPHEENVTLMAGRFPKVRPDILFDRILIYDAIHYSEAGELAMFMNASAEMLKPNGRMLIGNIPNRSMKHRFYSSTLGEAYGKEWSEAFKQKDKDEVAGLMKIERHAVDPDLPTHHDGTVLEMVRAYREGGFNAWIVPQDWRLPQGVEREDILVQRT